MTVAVALDRSLDLVEESTTDVSNIFDIESLLP